MVDSTSAWNGIAGGAVGAVVQAATINGGVHFAQIVPPVRVPRQLPLVTPHFVDRHEGMAVLDRVAAELGGAVGAPKLVLLTGQGGVGKTALAAAWASRNAETFADGQLYADLRGFAGDNPVDPEEVLGGFLRALGWSQKGCR